MTAEIGQNWYILFRHAACFHAKLHKKQVIDFPIGGFDWQGACLLERLEVVWYCSNTDVRHDKTMPVESHSALPVGRCFRGLFVGCNDSLRESRPGTDSH